MHYHDPVVFFCLEDFYLGNLFLMSRVTPPKTSCFVPDRSIDARFRVCGRNRKLFNPVQIPDLDIIQLKSPR